MSAKGHIIFLIKIIFIGSIVFIAYMFSTPGIAQEAPAQTKPATVKKNKPSNITMKVRSKGDFTGIVTSINTAGKTVTVRNRGIIVTFDAANTVFKGYNDLDQIKTGDKVAISYAGGSTRIARTGAIRSISWQETGKSGPGTVRQSKETTKGYKGRPVRITERTNSCSFKDVDNNGDGTITPAELSSVVPDLTVEAFKKYDKNGDGCISESEYRAINKIATRSHSQ